MKTSLRVLAVFLLAAIPAAYLVARDVTARAGRGESSDVHVGAQDSGSRIELQVGQHLVVELRANYSTGYSWEVVSSGEPVLRQEGSPAYKEDSHRPGAGGLVTYRFRAQQAGTASLELVYVRPWEKGVEPAERFSLTVTVSK